MIDNFDIIIPYLKFESDEDFYFLQIIQRKKDFEEGQQRLGRNNNNRLIKAYYIYSIEQLLSYKEEIVKLCSLFNARAGISLNRRNQKDVSLRVLEILAVALRCVRMNLQAFLKFTIQLAEKNPPMISCGW